MGTLMDFVPLQSQRVVLRPLNQDGDLDAYASWLNNAETTRYMASGRTPITTDELRDYIRSFARAPDGILFGMFDLETETHVGNVALQTIDWHDCRGEIGIVVGEPSARGKGYATEAVGLVVQHAFTQLGLRRLTAGYVLENTGSARLFEKLGFKVEGTLREHFLLEGEYLDCARVGLLRSEWPGIR